MHENLWAPWRLGYIKQYGAPSPPSAQVAEIEANPSSECFICRAVADPGNDQENLVIRRSKHTISILNRFPYNNGHLLVCPLRHVGLFQDLSSDEHLECMEGVRRWITQMTDMIRADGFNVGLNLGRIAGAGVPGHLHWHIVPRWKGDTNFMPVIGDAKVIPQSLEALWDAAHE